MKIMSLLELLSTAEKPTLKGSADEKVLLFQAKNLSDHVVIVGILRE